MEAAVVLLSAAVLVLVLVVAALSGTVPWLWWRAMKYESKADALEAAVAALDDKLAELLEAAGLERKGK